MDKDQRRAKQREHTKLRQQLADDADTFGTWTTFFRDAFRKLTSVRASPDGNAVGLAALMADKMLAEYTTRRAPFHAKRVEIVQRLQDLDDELE